MGFLKTLAKILGGNKYPKNECEDLGAGLPWFEEYHAQKRPSLTKFFNLEKGNAKTIGTTVEKVGFYKTLDGKKYYCLVTQYFDENQKKFNFYLPGWDYMPEEYPKGDKIDVLVDRNNYSKYEMEGIY